MNNAQWDHLKAHLLWYVALIVVAVLVGVLGYYALKTDKGEKADLIVDEVYFRTKELEGPTTDIDIIVFITNRGKNDVDGVLLRAFAIDTDSNLARSQDRTELGTLEAKKTGEGLLNVTVPNNDTYRIEIIVFADQKIAIRGSGTVDLTGIGTASDYKNEDDDDEDNGLGYRGAPSEGGSLACLFLFVVLGAGTVVVIIIIALVSTAKKEGGASRGPGMEPKRSRMEATLARPERRPPGDAGKERKD